MRARSGKRGRRPGRFLLRLSGLLPVFLSIPIPAAELSGEQLFVACSGCHGLEADAVHRIGPTLDGLAGRPAASVKGYPYSPALRESGLSWNEGTLTAWILAPEALVPGTWMLYHNALEPEEVRRLVDYLLAAP